MTVGSKIKQTLASLKGANSTLQIYAAQSQDVETQDVYHAALDMTSEVIQDLEIRLQTVEYEEPQYKGY